MTYRSQAAVRTSRVLIALVVITIAVVAYWGVNGGLEEIPINNQGTTAVSG
ncbi:MAG TPA: hypothetical protein VF115_15455 [Acidimicrobiia bacterium]